MAEVAPEKSRGLKFGERQLLRHGWEQGKGLGRGEDGIVEAIKVKVKCDKGGVGHKEGEQFTFHWWDHVFNKASASLQVESDQNGVKLKKTAEEKEEGMISNKKPRKATLAKAKLYGRFVKSATLLSGQEQPEHKPSNADDDSSSSDDDDDDDRNLDLSSATKLSDADLMKACGGRTAHKGARFGLTMSAKLARLEQQEAEFMAKYGKKSQTAAPSPVCVTPTAPTAEASPERPDETAEEPKSKKKIKRKKSAEGIHEVNGDEVDTGHKMKKKKKKASTNEDVDEMPVAVSAEEELINVENGEVDSCQLTKRKHKKKKKTAGQNGEVMEVTTPAERQAETDAEIKKKKKKKAKHHSGPVDVEERLDTESNQSEIVAPKAKQSKAAATSEEAEVTEGESTAKHKRKKCKENKRAVDDEAVPPKMKRKKKKKSDV